MSKIGRGAGVGVRVGLLLPLDDDFFVTWSVRLKVSL
jgi:hypothetical protein